MSEEKIITTEFLSFTADSGKKNIEYFDPTAARLKLKEEAK